jgi:hypothetical protein
MFTPQTILIAVGDGTEVSIYNSPHDCFWRIRSRHRVSRFSGIPDFGLLGHSPENRARVSDVGLRLTSEPIQVPEGWDRPFHSPQEAEEFVRRSASRES